MEKYEKPEKSVADWIGLGLGRLLDRTTPAPAAGPVELCFGHFHAAYPGVIVEDDLRGRAQDPPHERKLRHPIEEASSPAHRGGAIIRDQEG